MQGIWRRERRVLDREEVLSPHLGQNISTNHLLAVMTVSAINIKNVFFWKANILLSEISRVSYHWWMSPSFVDGNGTISWYCQYFLPDQEKHKFIFIFIWCIYNIFYRMGGGRGCWRGWVMGPLYSCFIVFADDHLARKFVYFTVCLWPCRTGWLI